jgi:hypothetical protein
MFQDVEDFANEFGLQEQISLFKKGALIAQRPGEVDSLAELNDEDRRVLRDEVTYKWRHPKALYLTIILNSIAAAIQGWDQTGESSPSPPPLPG